MGVYGERQRGLGRNGECQMIQTDKTVKQLLADLLLGDATRLWEGSCGVLSISQDREKVKELTPFFDEILKKSHGVALGGLLASNQRFVDQALAVIRFHKEGKGCACCLFGELFNPRDEEQKGNIRITEVHPVEKTNYVDYYTAVCQRCQKTYQIYEREYHFFWWEWVAMD